MIIYKNGEPCDHPGCLNHITHSCEGCGRIGGRGNSNIRYKLIRNELINMKKYVLFTYVDYEQIGGMNNLIDSFNTIEEIKNKVKYTYYDIYDYYQIVDRDTLEIVEEGSF